MKTTQLIAFVGAVSALLCLARVADAQNLAQSSMQAQGDSGDRQPFPLPDIEPLPESDTLTPPDTDSLEPTPTLEDPNSDISVDVQQIEVTGSTLFARQDFADILQPLEGRTVQFSELQAAAEAIAQKYQDAGYLTTQAILPEQDISDGTITIQILEGTLEAITIEGTEQLSEGYIRRRVERGVGTPLNLSLLEDQLALLGINPLFDGVDATIEAGSQPGQSQLTVSVDEASPFFGSLSFDNYSPPSIGSEQGTVQLGYRNLTGWGDVFSVAYSRSTSGGSRTWDLGYELPVNAMDGSISVRAVIDRNEVTEDEFEDLDIEGETELYEFTYRQPIIRTPRQELALSAGFSFRDGQTFAFGGNPTPFGLGPDEDGVSRTSVFRLGQDYLSRDRQGFWLARSQFNLGTGLFNATDNDGDLPDGQFFSWLGQAQRAQRLDRNHLLLIQADLQLTPHSLLPSEQFALGGGRSIRGYRQNARSGDNGFRVSIEDRITVARAEGDRAVLQLIPFMEVGRVWNHPDNPNPQPSDRTLASAGLGAIWNPIENLEVRVDYGIPFLSLDDEGDNLQDEGLHFRMGYRF